MSNISKRRKDSYKAKIKSVGGDHKEFLKRITKTLYYGQLPSLPCLSLPVTEISSELWSVSQRGRSLRRLHMDTAANIAHSACVSPCALVLAILYLERLKNTNPDYLAATAPMELFLVSLMVGNKFLQDDGEDEEVLCSEWAASGGMELKDLKKLEVQFLDAIGWNVYVSEPSFEAGLRWLEREVALRGARVRGYFTYSDLAAASPDPAVLLRLLFSTVLASTATLLASTLLLVQTCLPLAQLLATTPIPSTPTQLSANLHPTLSEQPSFLNNATTDKLIDDTVLRLIEEELIVNTIKCCTRWSQYKDTRLPRYDQPPLEWKLDPWWKSELWIWLYRSSLVNPMQRWLEKINEYTDLIRKEFKWASGRDLDRCYRATGRCARGGPMASFSPMLVSVADR